MPQQVLPEAPADDAVEAKEISSLSATGLTAEHLVTQHALELQAAEDRGVWRGQIETRLSGHDREFYELRGTISKLASEQSSQGKLIAEVHTTVTANLAATQAVQQRQDSDQNTRWQTRNFVIGISLAAASLAGGIGAVLAVVIK